MFKKGTTIHENYAARPIGIENLTLSQFATSYRKCKGQKNVKLNGLGVTEETGYILNHITGCPLPKGINFQHKNIID